MCLSACIYQRPHVQTSQNFLYMLNVAESQSSSDDSAIYYRLLVLLMTSCLPIIGQLKAMIVVHILSDSPGGRTDSILECGPMPNVMVALPNIGDALCSTPQSLADAHYLTAVQ